MKAWKILSAAILLAATGLASADPPKSASEFLSDAMKGDNSEISLGQLAQSRGNSAGVRDFGATLVRDHTAAKMAVSNVASAMGGPAPTDEMMPEAAAEKTKLNAMSGPSFDREFARYMVNDHRKDIAEFEAQAKSSDKTGALAAQQLPTLKKHLSMARSLESSSR